MKYTKYQIAKMELRETAKQAKTEYKNDLPAYWYKETKQDCIDQINEFYTGFYISDEFQLITE